MFAVLLALVVTFAEGDVTVRHGGVAKSAAPGDTLQDGDEVETGAQSRAEFAQGDGTLVRVGETSRIAVHNTSRRAFSAKLMLGDLWAKVHKLLAGDSFQIETENGVAGVRGTEFRLEARGDEHLLRVYEGVVSLQGSGFQHSVGAGREVRFRRDRSLR